MFPIARLIGNIFGRSADDRAEPALVRPDRPARRRDDGDRSRQRPGRRQRAGAARRSPPSRTSRCASCRPSSASTARMSREAGAARVQEPDGGEHRQAPLRRSSRSSLDGSIQGFTARLRWPGLLQRPRQRHLDPAAGRAEGDDRALPRGRLPAAHPHQRRRGDRARARRASRRRSPRSRAPTTATRCSTARWPMRRSSAAWPRSASAPTCSPITSATGATPPRADDGPRPRRAHGRLRHRARRRRAARDPLRCAGHAARAALHGLVRGQPADLDGPRPRREPSASASPRRCARSRSAPPTR